MKYWKENTDSHIRLVETDVYQSYKSLTGKVNEHGYIDHPLIPSDVIYMGTCDIISSIQDSDVRWSKMVHTNIHKNLPFVTIGSPAAGLPSMIRRLHSYIQNYGAPKYLFMSIARFEGYEFVNKSGNCYNVNSRAGTPRYLKKRNLLSDDEFDTWNMQIAAYKNLYNEHNNRYILEERFAFIEMLCKLNNIQLRWTFNPTDAAIVSMYKNISIFEDINDFMKDSFAGLAQISDMLPDRSIGIQTHQNIYEQFINPIEWDYAALSEQILLNYSWLESKYGTDLIKNEN